MRVAINSRKPNDILNWKGREIVDFKTIPNIGEYFALANSSSWYKVLVVTHCPFKESDCEAEILAIELEQTDAIKEAFKPFMNK